MYYIFFPFFLIVNYLCSTLTTFLPDSFFPLSRASIILVYYKDVLRQTMKRQRNVCVAR